MSVVVLLSRVVPHMQECVALPSLTVLVGQILRSFLILQQCAGTMCARRLLRRYSVRWPRRLRSELFLCTRNLPSFKFLSWGAVRRRRGLRQSRAFGLFLCVKRSMHVNRGMWRRLRCECRLHAVWRG